MSSIEEALTSKARFYPDKKRGLILRSKLKKMLDFEQGDLRHLEKINQWILNETIGYMLALDWELRDDAINELFGRVDEGRH